MNDNFKTARRVASAIGRRDIPIDVVPDYALGGANYGQELINNQPAGTYKYGPGPSTYLNIAPGTKTLATKQTDESSRQFNESFEEQKRAGAVEEDLSERKFLETIRANKASEALDRQRIASSGSNGGVTAYQQYQIMQDLEAKKQKYTEEYQSKVLDMAAGLEGGVSRQDILDRINADSSIGLMIPELADELKKVLDILSPSAAQSVNEIDAAIQNKLNIPQASAANPASFLNMIERYKK